MEIDGNVYYTNLIVRQGTTGYTRQAVKVAERYTFFISSFSEYKINAVMFNGKDVTDEVLNGYYTTPEIIGESILSISFEKETSSQSSTLNSVRITGYDGKININYIDEPSDVYVYSENGELVGKIPHAFGSASLQLSTERIYIVKIGEHTYKIAL